MYRLNVMTIKTPEFTKQELVQKAVEAINKMSPAEKLAARENLKRKLLKS